MTEAPVSALQVAVERIHGCKAAYRTVERVRETVGERVVWEGDVTVFTLSGHRTARTCYAWSAPVEGSDRRRFFAVLHEGPVQSAREAVRASILEASREEAGS